MSWAVNVLIFRRGRRFFSLTFGSCFRDEKTWMIKTFFEVWPQGAKDPGSWSNYCVAFAKQCSFTSLVTQKNAKTRWSEYKNYSSITVKKSLFTLVKRDLLRTQLSPTEKVFFTFQRPLKTSHFSFKKLNKSTTELQCAEHLLVSMLILLTIIYLPHCKNCTFKVHSYKVVHKWEVGSIERRLKTKEKCSFD